MVEKTRTAAARIYNRKQEGKKKRKKTQESDQEKKEEKKLSLFLDRERVFSFAFFLL